MSGCAPSRSELRETHHDRHRRALRAGRDRRDRRPARWRSTSGGDGGELAIEAKASLQDIVSEADRAVERLIRARVAAAFPDDGFLGEEYGLTEGASGFDLGGRSDRRHLALPVRDAELVRLDCGDPRLRDRDRRDRRADARRDLHGGAAGAGRDAQRRRPAARSPICGCSNAATGVGASHRTDPDWIGRVTEDLGRQGGVFFRNGSGALMLAYVAAGRLAGYIEPHMHAWDCLAGLLMIREAGGRTAPFPGGRRLMRGGRVIAAAPAPGTIWSRLMGD